MLKLYIYINEILGVSSGQGRMMSKGRCNVNTKLYFLSQRFGVFSADMVIYNIYVTCTLIGCHPRETSIYSYICICMNIPKILLPR